jgi:hypothetical protein
MGRTGSTWCKGKPAAGNPIENTAGLVKAGSEWLSFALPMRRCRSETTPRSEELAKDRQTGTRRRSKGGDLPRGLQNSSGWGEERERWGIWSAMRMGKGNFSARKKSSSRQPNVPRFGGGSSQSFPDIPLSGVAPRTPPDVARCARTLKVHRTERLGAA